MLFRFRVLAVSALLLITLPLLSFKFEHPSDIVKAMKKQFKVMKSYKADFKISVINKNRSKVSAGTAYFQSPGMINFTFSSPFGDKIISNGRTMWVYIKRMNAVGIQELDYKKKGKSIYETSSYDGLVALFRRYHYQFKDQNQPETIEGKKYYVLKLNEKTASGGFSDMLLYVDSETKLIDRIDAFSESGRKVTLKFTNIAMNPELKQSLFRFRVEGNIKTLENPLTTE